MEHTPIPWNRNDDGFLEGSNGKEVVFTRRAGFVYGDHTPETEANAAFIVRAVNSHEALVEALEAILAQYDSMPDGVLGHGLTNGPFLAAREALAKAKS